MKNQMMNLFASYSFIIFRAIITARTVSAAKTTLSDRRSLDPSKRKEMRSRCLRLQQTPAFLFPDTHKRMHKAVPVFRLRYQPNTGMSIFQSVFIKQTKPEPVI